MGKENNRSVGTRWEQYAAEWLALRGYRIITLNFRSKFGEIDIIAKDGSYLVFIEVKYRKTSGYGDGIYAVTPAKQRKICKTAGYFLMSKHYNYIPPIRFDVVSIMNDEISLYKNAFEWVN